MKTKIKFSVVVLLLSFFTINADAQIKRFGWYGNPVVKLDNPIYTTAWSIGFPLLFKQFSGGSDEKMTKGMMKLGTFITPRVGWKPNVIQHMEFADGDARINPKLLGFSHIDWNFRNYSVGYKVGYMPRVARVGFEVEADYIQDGYQIRMPDKYDVQQSIIKRMISGQVVMKYRFGNSIKDLTELNTEEGLDFANFFKGISNFYVEIGGGYQYALHYHDKEIHDKDAVNNGFIGIVGAGAYFPNVHLSFGIRYEHTFYDYYNKDFVYNGMPIFEGSKSTFGKIYTTVSFSLF